MRTSRCEHKIMSSIYIRKSVCTSCGAHEEEELGIIRAELREKIEGLEEQLKAIENLIDA